MFQETSTDPGFPRVWVLKDPTQRYGQDHEALLLGWISVDSKVKAIVTELDGGFPWLVDFGSIRVGE